MQRIRLTLEYDGADFAGWQYQPGQRTVQSVVEAAVARLLSTEERISVVASGRTDAGVHARAQVVAFDDPRGLPMIAFTRGLQGELPQDVAVVAAEVAAPDFDPRRQATGKRYVYRIWNGDRRRPLLRRSTWFRSRPLDLLAMQEGAKLLLGEHDFSSFQARGCTASTTIRTLTQLRVEGATGDEIRVTAEGNGFLRHMVRNLVGTLVEVGEGHRSAESLTEVLAAARRSAAGRTAPPEGLCLDAVYYGGPVGE